MLTKPTGPTLANREFKRIMMQVRLARINAAPQPRRRQLFAALRKTSRYRVHAAKVGRVLSQQPRARVIAEEFGIAHIAAQRGRRLSA
jgi:hypothetical protein